MTAFSALTDAHIRDFANANIAISSSFCQAAFFVVDKESFFRRLAWSFLRSCLERSSITPKEHPDAAVECRWHLVGSCLFGCWFLGSILHSQLATNLFETPRRTFAAKESKWRILPKKSDSERKKRSWFSVQKLVVNSARAIVQQIYIPNLVHFDSD